MQNISKSREEIMGFLRNIATAALLVAAGVTSSHAQDYPKDPIQLVVPTTPGAGMDITARLFAKFLQERIGKEVIVLNKPGAQTLIGAKYVAIQPPNGYTLLFSTNITNFPV